MDTAARVEELIAPALDDMGYALVRVQLSGDGRRRQLQVMAERHDQGAMTVDDCAAISHLVSALLDAEDPIKGAYALEVSSPGVDRPLTRPEDYRRFAGHVARLELHAAIGGRRRFEGRLEGIDERVVRIVADGESLALPYEEIARAKLVITDELLTAVQEPAPAKPRRLRGNQSRH